MKELGSIISVSASDMLVTRVKDTPKLGVGVFNKNSKRIGIIESIIGPTRNPYVLIKPAIKSFASYVGKSVYI